MTTEELVDRLRTYPTKKLQSVALDAADLIERQAGEINRLRLEYDKALAHGQQQAKALEEAEKALQWLGRALAPQLMRPLPPSPPSEP